MGRQFSTSQAGIYSLHSSLLTWPVNSNKTRLCTVMLEPLAGFCNPAKGGKSLGWCEEVNRLGISFLEGRTYLPEGG